MIGAVRILVWVLLFCFAPSGCTRNEATPEERARALLEKVPLVDGHNDLSWRFRPGAEGDRDRLDLRKEQPHLYTDIPRLEEGGLGGQFWSVFVPCSMKGDEAVRMALELFDVIHRMNRRYSDVFALALTADDIDRIFRTGRIASLIGVEGGHAINNSLGTLRMFHRLGARYMTLTHARNCGWADSATDGPGVGGLSAFGEKVILEMNRLGMLVDLSHVSTSTMVHALRVSRSPVIFSHSSARALVDIERNVPDHVLDRVKENQGLVMVTFVGSFVCSRERRHREDRARERDRLVRVHGGEKDRIRKGLEVWENTHPRPRAALADVMDHIDHIKNRIGVDHVGIGSDFEGTRSVPEGLEDVSKFKDLVAEMFRRGYTEEEAGKVAGLNLLRVLRAAEESARDLQRAGSNDVRPGS